MPPILSGYRSSPSGHNSSPSGHSPSRLSNSSTPSSRSSTPSGQSSTPSGRNSNSHLQRLRTRMRRPKLTAPATAALALILLAGCAGMGGPGIPDMAGTYQGTITVEGQAVPGTLVIEQEARALQLELRLPQLAVTARGEGQITDDGFTGEMAYNLNCPGTATMEGTRQDEGALLTGSLRAQDCMMNSAGSFRFSR